jgi:branched-chain amino acid transport system substrate-binding protein
MKKFNQYLLLLILIGVFFTLSGNLGSAIPEARADKIKIGGIGPLAITPGKDMEKGLQLAVKEINEGDGVTVGATTYDFDLIIETTSSPSTGLPEPATGLASLTKLLDQDDVAALIGGFRTEVVMGLQGQLDRPMLGVGSTAPLITPYLWRLGPSNGTQLTRALVDFYAFGLASIKGVQNVTIVREDAAWSLAMSNGLHFYLQEYLPGNTPYGGAVAPQMNFTSDIVIPPTNTFDQVSAALAPLQSDYQGKNVTAIMHIFSGPVGKYVPQAWAALDLPQYLAGINVESQASGFFEETEGACYGEIELETCPPDITQTNKTAAFKAAYEAEYGEEPTYTAFASYDSVYVLKDAMERADSLEVADLQAALADTHYTGTAYEIKFTSEDNVWDHPIFGYPYGQVGYYDNGTRYVIVPGTEDLIVHDLYTIGTVGVRGQPYMQGFFAQWQQGGVKKTVWNQGPTVNDDIGNFSSKVEWPIDHSEHGYVPETTTTTDAATTTTSEETTTTTTVVDVPGFEFSLILFVFTTMVYFFIRKKPKKS